MVVVPRESVAIEVTDMAGRPAPYAILEFEPLGFAARNLVSEAVKPRGRATFGLLDGVLEVTSSVREPVSWPYHVDPEPAGEKGRLTFVGSAGTWQVSVRSRYSDKQASIVSSFEVPHSAPFFLKVPGVLSTVNGCVLLERDGMPLYDAEVHFGPRDSPDVVYTDVDGRFTISEHSPPPSWRWSSE